MKHLWLLTAAVGSAVPCLAQQQTTVGRVSAIQRVVERSSGNSAFGSAKAGTALQVGDSIRTGRRSKADLNFTDGSLLRLGQLATVQMQGAKQVHLSSGRLLFSMLKPGRVLAGTAAAEIKGSVGIITIMDNGATEFSLYSGIMDVVTDKETVSVPPGSYVTIFKDGTRSPVRIAPPLQFASNQKDMSLLEEPSDVPYVGSRADAQSRQTPEKLLLNDNYYLARNPAEIPFPASFVRPGSGRSGPEDALVALGLAVGTALLTQPKKPDQPDLAHIAESDPKLGRKFNTDATLAVIGSASDGGNGPNNLVAGRLRAFYSQGPAFAQIAVSPRTIHRSTGTSPTNLGLVSDASLTLRTNRGDLEFGRQRMSLGPTRATVIGAIARQGGRNVFDGVTFRPNLGRQQSAQISYLYDAHVLKQPYHLRGAQHAFYARAAIERRYGNFGINVLRYSVPAINTTNGVSIDFTLPIVRNELELYGEFGRDVFRRKQRTIGLHFPGIYDQTGVEAYLEYASLSKRPEASQPADELSLLLYKRLNRKSAIMASATHLKNNSNVLTVGITTSAQNYLTDGD